MGRVFANGPGDLGSIPGRVIPKTFSFSLISTLWSNGTAKSTIPLVTATTGVKNQSHDSRTDEDVYLYLRRCSAQASVHSLTWKLKQNKCTHKCPPKRKHTTKVKYQWWFESNELRESTWVGRVFANGPGDLGSIPGRVIPKN